VRIEKDIDALQSTVEEQNDEVDSNASNDIAMDLCSQEYFNDVESESQASDSSATSFDSNCRSSDSGDTMSSSEEREAAIFVRPAHMIGLLSPRCIVGSQNFQVEFSSYETRAQRRRRKKKKNYPKVSQRSPSKDKPKRHPWLMNYIGKRGKRGDFVASNHRPLIGIVKANRCALVSMFWGDYKYWQRMGVQYYFAPVLLPDHAVWWQTLSAKQREEILSEMQKKERHYGHFSDEAARDLMRQFNLTTSHIRCLQNRELETVGIYGRFDGIKLGIIKVPEWNCTGLLIVLEDYYPQSANTDACIEKCSFITAVRKKNASRWSPLILGNYLKGNLCIEPCVEALTCQEAMSVTQAAKLIRDSDDKIWIRFRRFQDRKEKGRPPMNEQLYKRIKEMMQ